MSKIKIVCISHTFVNEVAQRRWKLLAKDKLYEIHLIAPQKWETTWFGKNEKLVYTPFEIHDNNFHVHLIKTTDINNHSKYLYISIDAKFRKIKPDIIYIIHEESIRIHQQIYFYKKFFAKHAKIIFFSMNANGVSVKHFYNRWMWEKVKRNTDCALVHYPGCLKSLRDGGYKKPVFLQTQIGVDESIFKPNIKMRNEYRIKLGFENKFVIGYTGRLIIDKGVADLLSVFPLNGVDWALLLVGNGNLNEEIKNIVNKNGWKNRVHITGFVDQNEVPNYMNAMDIFVLGSKTMPYWKDTFPLVTVQAQACGVPVIASDSASLPWQLGDSAQFYPEGDTEVLKKCIYKYLENIEYKNNMIIKGKNRSFSYFSQESITKNFKEIVEQVINSKYIYHDNNEEYTQWKAY